MEPQKCAEHLLQFCKTSLSDRGDTDEFILFLLESDFFTAPASTKFHAAFSGGLFLHSWGVFKRLQMFIKRSPENMEKPDIVVQMLIALFHDLCKVGMYEQGHKWTKINNKWVELDVWQHNDMIPLGHGEKSLYLLQTYLRVEPDEACAIRWHSNRHETGTHFFYPTGASLNEAMKKYPITKYLHLADLFQTYAYEIIGGIIHDGELIDRTENPFEPIIDVEKLKETIVGS